MLVKSFKQIVDRFHRRKEAQEYDGFVEDNNDPKKLGRVKVRTELYEDVDCASLPWCYPTPNFFLGNSKDSICFSVPEIGSQVKVYYPTHDKTIPFYKGMEFNEKNKSTFFEIDYPNTYGFKDSRGNFIIVNKATDITQYHHSSGTNLKIESDGTWTLSTPDGSYIYSDCNGNMRMCGKTLTIDMSESIIANSPSISITGTGENGNVSIDSNTIYQTALSTHAISGNDNLIYATRNINIRTNTDAINITSATNVNANCNSGSGTFAITGYETVSKDVTITGKETVNGSSGVSVPNGDVVASGISLVNHTHPFNYNAGNNPSQGTSDKPQ